MLLLYAICSRQCYVRVNVLKKLLVVQQPPWNTDIKFPLLL